MKGKNEIFVGGVLDHKLNNKKNKKNLQIPDSSKKRNNKKYKTTIISKENMIKDLYKFEPKLNNQPPKRKLNKNLTSFLK